MYHHLNEEVQAIMSILPMMHYTLAAPWSYIDIRDASSLMYLLSISEEIFFGVSVVVLMTFAGLLNYLRVASTRVFLTLSIYTFLWFIILSLNNVKTILTIPAQSTLKVFFLFSVIFLLILYAYFKDKLITTNIDFIIVINLALLSMSFIPYTNDLFLWFLAIELQSFAFYALASYRTNRSFLQSEAGLKYFFFGSIASSLYLFGLSILYFLTGHVDLTNLAAYLYFEANSSYLVSISILMLFISLFFKIGIAPFHLWTPQVYTYSSSIITFLFLLLPKIPLIYILYMLLHFEIKPIYYVGVASSLFIGSIYAFYFSPLKTFIAYSGIANNAFLLAPLFINSLFSFNSFLSFLIVYNVVLVIIFTCLLFVTRFHNVIALNNLRDFIILKKSNLFIAITMTIAFLNFAGIPPFVGFFSKIIVLMSTLSYSLYTINFILLAASVLTVYYYIRVIKIMFFSSQLKYAGLSSISVIPSFIIALSVYFSMGFIFFPEVIFDLIFWSPRTFNLNYDAALTHLALYKPNDDIARDIYTNRIFVEWYSYVR
jgi:NADH-quinone oxidoreductase subunit N